MGRSTGNLAAVFMYPPLQGQAAVQYIEQAQSAEVILSYARDLPPVLSDTGRADDLSIALLRACTSVLEESNGKLYANFFGCLGRY